MLFHCRKHSIQMISYHFTFKFIQDQTAENFSCKNCANVVVSIHAIATFQTFTIIFAIKLSKLLGQPPGSSTSRLFGMLAAFAAVTDLPASSSPSCDAFNSLKSLPALTFESTMSSSVAQAGNFLSAKTCWEESSTARVNLLTKVQSFLCKIVWTSMHHSIFLRITHHPILPYLPQRNDPMNSIAQGQKNLIFSVACLTHNEVSTICYQVIQVFPTPFLLLFRWLDWSRRMVFVLDKQNPSNPFMMIMKITPHSSDRTLKKTAHLIETFLHPIVLLECHVKPDLLILMHTGSLEQHRGIITPQLALTTAEYFAYQLEKSMGSWRRSARKTRLSRLHVSITQIPILKMAHDGLSSNICQIKPNQAVPRSIPPPSTAPALVCSRPLMSKDDLQGVIRFICGILNELISHEMLPIIIPLLKPVYVVNFSKTNMISIYGMEWLNL
ncbi:hypothetical protein VP01_1719g2 [Puccinia sorghi]|uniref:Uncharacterized protein n=1 Tax=Puccinia sorghi TaxID=27349 RepID=A0A0L6VFG5_9BASI|nr:hypothetical protein VP01_1719g2 [Puccinia sorghi]